TQATEFGAQTATRSPGSTPSAMSPRATLAASSRRARSVSAVAPSATTTSSGWRAAWSRSIRGIVPQSGTGSMTRLPLIGERAGSLHDGRPVTAEMVAAQIGHRTRPGLLGDVVLDDDLDGHGGHRDQRLVDARPPHRVLHERRAVERDVQRGGVQRPLAGDA